MKVLVVGGGGREHALVRKIKESKKVDEIFCTPGNGGISYDAKCFDVAATDIDGVVNLAKEIKADLVVVAPDDPLVAGMVDALNEAGFKTFGPRANAAIIEGSKVFSKELMQKYNIPTAEYKVFDNAEEAIDYIKERNEFPTVIKADGLALGKGVIIPENLDDAIAGVKEIMEDKIFGASGNNIVVEEFLTGGMGTVSPNPYYTQEVAKECMDKIFMPTINAMNNEGRTFKGCLYFGLMITPKGPKVIEYNCRFGDPETQVVLPRLKTDIVDIFEAIDNETLSDLDVEWSDDACACVIMASGGYPKSYPKGIEITGLSNGQLDGVTVYHAGTKLQDNKLVTSGGRVLGVTALGDTLENALKKSYDAVEKIHFEGAHYRRDIGKRALEANK